LRDKVLGIGDSFSLAASSNSTRRPKLFDWTEDPSQATVDTVVCIQSGIVNAIDRPGRKIGWLNESPAITRWQTIRAIIHADLDRYMSAYEFILTADRAECELHPRFIYHPAGSNLPWIPEYRYGIHPKSRMCSMIASAKNMVEGHHYRLQVAARLKDSLDLYGGACGSPRIGERGPYPDKSGALLDYRFHVAMENCQVPFYYTERLTDCMATGTVPIYWGADCIEEVCNPDGVIVLDDEFDVGMLDEALYRDMLPAIRENLAIVRQLEGADDLLYRTYIQTARAVPIDLPTQDAIAEHSASGSADCGMEDDRRDQPGQQQIGDLPFIPWDPTPILELHPPPRELPHCLLQAVIGKDKHQVQELAEIPQNLLSTRNIRTRMCRPKTLRGDEGDLEWFPQLEQAFLLHLPGGFIGDNVVFDRNRYYSFNRWWLGPDWRYYQKTRYIHEIEAGISLGAWGGEAFQHFIMDVVPTLAGVIDLLESPGFENFKIVSHRRGARVARWFWKRLGLEDRVVQKPLSATEGMVVYADRVMFPQFMPTLGEIGLYPRDLLRPIQKRFGLLDPVPTDRVIYLQRPHHFPRKVANEEALLNRLRKMLAGSGYELEVFEGPKLEFEDDLERFRRARVILGPHGGAMANMAFAQPGTHVIEFLPIYRNYREAETKHDSRAMFWGLAQAAGLDYWTVEPDRFAYEERQGMVVDVEEVAAIVEQLLSIGAS
jgi:hypothetical protein